jgi:hypothetical protein
MLKPTLIATAIAGTLDIVFAAILSMIFGKGPAAMLRSVASGPFPGATKWEAAGSTLGLVTHFVLMAIMAATYMAAARRIPTLVERPIQWGVLYGLATYAVMNLIVVPVRFGAPLPPEPRAIATQLFAHIVLVGIPIALVAARYLRPRAA